MITEYFCKGLLIGLIFGVPAGAIVALTIGRTLEKEFFTGFLTGMGSSAADGYGDPGNYEISLKKE